MRRVLHAEGPQLRLGNSSWTHVLHALVRMRTFPEGISGIHEVMRFNLRPGFALRPSDVVGPSEETGYPPTLRTGQKIMSLLSVWLA